MNSPKYFLFVLAFAMLCFSFTMDSPKAIIEPGKGFLELQIGKSRVKEVQELMNEQFRAIIHNYHHTGTTLASLNYDNLGLRFQFTGEGNSPKLTYIYVTKPFACETKEGIALEKSTFKDVVSKYGSANWKFSGHDLYKEYNGITFLGDTQKQLSYKDLADQKKLDDLFLDLPVYKIIITPKK